MLDLLGGFGTVLLLFTLFKGGTCWNCGKEFAEGPPKICPSCRVNLWKHTGPGFRKTP